MSVTTQQTETIGSPTVSGDTRETSATPISRPPMNERDAQELAARHVSQARAQAHLRGWKPLTIWYVLWMLLAGWAAVASLFSGKVGAGFALAAVSVAAGAYAKYLYNGGRRRVWFFVW